MIKINVFNEADFQQVLANPLNIAVRQFITERRAKSFSERNPELSKMINCPVCELRHRMAHVCTPVYATSATETIQAEDGSIVPMPMMAAQNTKKGVMGAKAFHGRILKHRNAWGLQVLERATALYNHEMSFYPNVKVSVEQTKEQNKEAQDFMDKIGKQSLSRALNEKRAKRAARRRELFQITRESRRINCAA